MSQNYENNNVHTMNALLIYNPAFEILSAENFLLSVHGI